MYALAQLFAIAVAIMDLRAISVQPAFVNPGALRTRTHWLPIVVFWLAVFSHLVTALLLPAMVAVALVIFGRSLPREQCDLTLALAVCALAPVLPVLLTGAIGPGAGTALEGRAEGLPGVSFLME